MKAKDITLNKDRECPNCGSTEVGKPLSPGKIFEGVTGNEIPAHVGYRKVVTCTECRHTRGG